MDLKEENICRLCFKETENDFEIIDEIIIKIFEILLLKVNLDISKDPVICKDCAQVVEKCFNFKSICIDTEELKLSFAIDKNRATFRLQDVSKSGKDIKTVDNICRFCAKYLNGNNIVLLDTLMKDITFAKMLQGVMPEIDFNIIKNPVICTTCRQDLECYFKFVENCLDIEKKITKHFQNVGISSSTQIKLSEISFLFNNILELDNTLMCEIKQEEETSQDVGKAHSEVYNGDLIKTQETTDIKEEKADFNETAYGIPSDIFVYKINIPCEIKTSIKNAQTAVTQNKALTPSESGIGNTNQTKYKDEVNKKNDIHKNNMDVKTYECLTCTDPTKYKGSLKRHPFNDKDIIGVETYKCPMCTYLQKREESGLHMLTNSHMSIHNDVKMHKCSVCNFQTKHRTSLKNHMVIHEDSTQVKMYKCSMCPFGGIHKRNLGIHMLQHKDVTEVEWHQCSMCAYKTRYKSYLRKHTAKHRDEMLNLYTCSMCT